VHYIRHLYAAKSSGIRICSTSDCQFFKVNSSLNASTLEEDTTTLSRNVEHQSPMDFALYPRRTETHDKLFTLVEHTVKRDCLSASRNVLLSFIWEFSSQVWWSARKRAVSDRCPIMFVRTWSMQHVPSDILACYLAMNMTYCHFWGPPSLYSMRTKEGEGESRVFGVRETGHSLPRTAKVTGEWSCTSTAPIPNSILLLIN
jgi:hypothetical protein